MNSNAKLLSDIIAKLALLRRLTKGESQARDRHLCLAAKWLDKVTLRKTTK